jgi:hypothetical protein
LRFSPGICYTQWLLRAAKHWNLQAQYNLALCYDEGFGVEKDIGDALEWATIAATHGYTTAESLCEIITTENNLTASTLAEAKERAEKFTNSHDKPAPPIRQWPDAIDLNLLNGDRHLRATNESGR